MLQPLNGLSEDVDRDSPLQKERHKEITKRKENGRYNDKSNQKKEKNKL
jgi:hypothetical protein